MIEGADARHLALSLRARPGEEIEVIDPDGFMLTVRLDEVSASRVEGVVVAERALPVAAGLLVLGAVIFGIASVVAITGEVDTARRPKN